MMAVILGACIVPTGPESVNLPPPRSSRDSRRQRTHRCSEVTPTLDDGGIRRDVHGRQGDVVDLGQARVVSRRLGVNPAPSSEEDERDDSQRAEPDAFHPTLRRAEGVDFGVGSLRASSTMRLLSVYDGQDPEHKRPSLLARFSPGTSPYTRSTA